MKYRYLVLSGGSTGGIAQVAVLEKLFELKLLKYEKIKEITGSSVGSLNGCFILLNIKPEQIWKFLLSINFQKLINLNYTNVIQDFGIENGNILQKLMENILERKTNIKNITFKQLKEKYNKLFTVVGTCLTTKQSIYYNYINTPDFEVSLALRISISMPGFFNPVIIDDKTYLDGGMLDNYAIHLYDEKLNKTIGILATNNYNTDYKCLEQYLMAIYNLFMYHFYDRVDEKYKNNTIIINRELNPLSSFNFSLDNESKKILYDLGIESVNNFLNNSN